MDCGSAEGSGQCNALDKLWLKCSLVLSAADTARGIVTSSVHTDPEVPRSHLAKLALLLSASWEDVGFV